jgi:hypothetical protein
VSDAHFGRERIWRIVVVKHHMRPIRQAGDEAKG